MRQGSNLQKPIITVRSKTRTYPLKFSVQHVKNLMPIVRVTLIRRAGLIEYPKHVERRIANVLLLSSKSYLRCSTSPESSFQRSSLYYALRIYKCLFNYKGYAPQENYPCRVELGD